MVRPGAERVMEASIMVTMKQIFETALISELRLPEVVTVEEATPLGEVWDLMCKHRFGSAPIVRDGKLVGIFTERDWLNRVLCKNVSLDRPISDVMTPNPTTLGEFDRMWRAAEIMGEQRIRHLPIVDDEGCPKSMISVRDVLQYLAECFPEEFLAHPPDPDNICLQAESG